MIRIGFWGILYHEYIKDPKTGLVILEAPILRFSSSGCRRCVGGPWAMRLRLRTRSQVGSSAQGFRGLGV